MRNNNDAANGSRLVSDTFITVKIPFYPFCCTFVQKNGSHVSQITFPPSAVRVVQYAIYFLLQIGLG